MKKLFSKIKSFLSKIRWVIRRKFNQLKSVVISYFSLGYNKISRKTQRSAKKRVKRDFVKDYLGYEDYNLDIRFDVDSDKLRNDITQDYKKVKVKKYLDHLDDNELVVYNAEKERINALFQARYILALELENKISELDFEKEKQIRKISSTKSYQDEEVERISDETSIETERLRDEYNRASKELLTVYKPVEGETERLELALLDIRLKNAYKFLPESRKSRERKDKARKITKGFLQAFIYLAPIIVLLSIFTFYPIFNSFRLVVFENYNEATGKYSGFTLFGNFKKVLNDANFIVPGKYVKSSAMINTLLIVGVTVPLSIIIALLISVLLNSIKAFSNVLQTIFFLPYVTNSIAVGLVFAYMFQNNGLFNKFLNIFGVDGGRWVQHGAPYWKAMFVLMLFSIWNGLAFKIMVFLSSIQGIDKQYYQAASIDATPRFKQFTRITAPLISPTILYVLITSVIGAFKTYSSVIAIFGNRGRPPGADYHLKTIVFYIYDYFEYSGKMPEAAAASIVLFVIILIITIIQMQVSKKRVHY